MDIHIIGQKLSIKADNNPDHIKKLVSYVQRRADEISSKGKPLSTSTIALLTAINIADDYFRLLQESHEFKEKVSVQSKVILKELE